MKGNRYKSLRKMSNRELETPKEKTFKSRFVMVGHLLRSKDEDVDQFLFFNYLEFAMIHYQTRQSSNQIFVLGCSSFPLLIF